MNTGRIHRLLRLITLLQSGADLTAEALAREVGVSRRTLFRDLKILEQAGIPYQHRTGRGYAIVPSFFLPPVNLKVTEALGLMLMAKGTSAYTNQPLTTPAAEAVRKLIAMLPEPIRRVCHEMSRRVTMRAPVSPRANGSDCYPHLQQAIDEQRAVRLEYDSIFDGEPITTVFQPYHLHFDVRSWYVIGHSAKHKQVRTFKLARVKSIALLGQRFSLKKPFDIDAYLGQAWRLIPEGRVYNIELEFAPKVARNVAEVHWHHTQTHRLLDDGRCRMCFQIDGLEEIHWWVLGYGDQVKVIKPRKLRTMIVERYKQALEVNQ